MQPTYLPWVGYFDLMDQSDVFVFLDSVQFDKRSWQQRNRIKCPKGEQILTVPVLSKGQFYQKINEVCVDPSSDFREGHIKAVQLNYAKSKYFQQYFDGFAGILRKKHTLLADLNIDLITWFKDILGIQAQLLRSSGLKAEGKKTELLVDICKVVQADHYLSPAGSKVYISENNLFEEHGIRLSYQNYQPIVYRQIYGDFVPYLCALDLLFNEGEQSLSIVRSGRRPNVSGTPETLNVLKGTV